MFNKISLEQMEINDRDKQSGADDPIYEPDNHNFKVTIEYNDNKITREYQYDANADMDGKKVIMISVVGDMIADSLEDIITEVTR